MARFTLTRICSTFQLPALTTGLIASCVGVSLFCGVAQGGDQPRDDGNMTTLWRHAIKTGPLPLGCNGTPAVGKDGAIYVPAGNFLYALNSDGSEKWSQGEKRGLVTVTDVAIDEHGTIYTQSDALSAFRPDGSLKWRVDASEIGLGLPSAAIGRDGTLYFMRSGKLCAVDEDGVVKWESETGGSSLYSPVIDSEDAIHCNGGSGMHTFGADGKLKRVFEYGRGYRFFPAIDQSGNLYFGGPGKTFYSVDSNARPRWVFKTDGDGSGPPAIAPDGTIYFGGSDGNLYALDQSGGLKWKFRTNGPVYSAPAIDSEGNIYFASWDKNFYCVDSNGSLKSTLKVTAGYGSPIIAADGTIYLVDVGYIYAIAGFAPPSPGPWPMKRHDAQGTARVSSLETK